MLTLKQITFAPFIRIYKFGKKASLDYKCIVVSGSCFR